MFRFIAIMLATVLCLPAAETMPRDVRTIALEIPTGALVRIQTTDRHSIRGKLSAISTDGVTVQLIENDRITEQAVPFATMKSIKQTDKPMSPGTAVLSFFGVIYGLAFLVAGIAHAVN